MDVFLTGLLIGEMCADEDPKSTDFTDWKSDPLVSCCCNLFIKDILELNVHPCGSEEGTVLCTKMTFLACFCLNQLNNVTDFT